MGANTLNNFTEGLLVEQSFFLVGGVSFAWLALGSTLSVSVNWDVCVEHYRTWQSRNGRFTFTAAMSAAAAVGLAIDADMSATASSWGSHMFNGEDDSCDHRHSKMSGSTAGSWEATILGAKTDLHDQSNHPE